MAALETRHDQEVTMGILESLGFGGPQPDPMQAQQMQQPMPQQQGFGSRINQGIADNSGMMMALGGQLLAHRNNAANAPFDAQALMVGQQVDEKRRDKRKEEEKERRGRQAAIQSLLELGIAPNEQVAGQLVDVHPDLAAKALEKQHLSSPEKPPEAIRTLQMLNQNPDLWEPYERMKGASRAQNNINVGTGETGFDKKVGESLGEQFMELQMEGAKAQQTLSTLDVMGQAMDSPEFYSGAGGNFELQRRRILSALGGDPEAAASMEAFHAQSSKMALENLGGSLGVAVSDGDRDFVVGQVANLGNTPQGNRLLLEINKRTAQRKAEVAQLAREYAKQNGGRLDAEFYGAVAQYAEQNPLFADMPGFGAQPTGDDSPPPPGVDPEDWRFMTPEQRALWQ